MWFEKIEMQASTCSSQVPVGSSTYAENGTFFFSYRLPEIHRIIQRKIDNASFATVTHYKLHSLRQRERASRWH